MSFFQQESSNPLGQLVAWLAYGVVAVFFGFVMDACLQANGLYGSRTLASETITRKVMESARRNSRIPTIYVSHRGQSLRIPVLGDEYDAVSVGQKLNIIVVPGRLGLPQVFLDRPGIKHSPNSRTATFGFVIVSNFGLLFLLFQYLLNRARRAEEGRTTGFQARRLGLTSR